jgi:hypothetical protein
MLNTVIRAMGDILRLRGGPQNLPTSYPLLAGASMAFLVCGMLLFRLQGMSGPLPLLQSLVSLGVLAAYVHTLLQLRRFSNRFPQTLTALVIVSSVFSLLAYWPISVLVPYMAEMRGGGAPQAPAAPTLLLLALAVWSLSVQAYVLRVAMEVRMLAAFALVLLYEVLSVLIVNLLFGQAVGQSAIPPVS